MSTSLADVTLPMFIAGLRSLKRFLKIGAAHAETKKIDPRALLDARLFPDMFSLTRQVQVATDIARRGAERLVGTEPSSVEDVEISFEELISRVEATIAHVEAIDRNDVDAAREITINIGEERTFSGSSFALQFALPNFMFHLTTAYNILREGGIELGKRDYLGAFIAGESLA